MYTNNGAPFTWCEYKLLQRFGCVLCQGMDGMLCIIDCWCRVGSVVLGVPPHFHCIHLKYNIKEDGNNIDCPLFCYYTPTSLTDGFRCGKITPTSQIPSTSNVLIYGRTMPSKNHKKELEWLRLSSRWDGLIQQGPQVFQGTTLNTYSKSALRPSGWNQCHVRPLILRRETRRKMCLTHLISQEHARK